MILEMKTLPTINSILDIYDPDLLLILLEMLDDIFKFGQIFSNNDENLEFFEVDKIESKNKFVIEFKSIGGGRKIELLLEHNNPKIREKSSYLLNFLK